MLGHCILVGSKQGNRGKTQALVDGNGPLQPVTPQLAMTGMGHLRKLASDCFLEDNRAHLSHRGIRGRLAEVNLKPTEASKAGKALQNKDLPPPLFEMPTFHHG